MLVPNFACTILFYLPLSVHSVQGSLLLRIQFVCSYKRTVFPTTVRATFHYSVFNSVQGPLFRLIKAGVNIKFGQTEHFFIGVNSPIIYDSINRCFKV